MLVYIIHSDKLYPFSLPESVSGNYMIEDFDSNGVAKGLINVIAKDSKWFMYSNENVRIFMDNKFVESCELDLYNCYVLFTSEGERILLYPMPSYDNKYIVKAINGEGSIIVGSSSKCNIVYNRNGFFENQLEIFYKNSKWYVKNLDVKIDLYVNTVKVTESRLDSFDKVFIAGFRFVVCGKMIIINDSFGDLVIKSDLLVTPGKVLAASDYHSDFQNYNDFYNEKDYFNKSPVFLKKINETELDLQPPEDPQSFEYEPLIMTLIPSALMGITTLITTYYTIRSFSTGEVDNEVLYTTIVMLVVMFILCFIWPFVERFVEKARIKLTNKSNKKLYENYLKEKEEFLAKLSSEQKASLFFNNPSVEECQNIIFNRSANLFSLSAGQDQFLTIRLGTGKVLLNCNIHYSKPELVKYENPLQKRLEELVQKYKYIDYAPLTFSLKRSIAFLNASGKYNSYIESIVLQLATLHDYHEVKIAVFTSEGSKLHSIRDLNHCWSNERDFRYIATNLQEAESLSAELVRIYSKRIKDNEKSSFNSYFIILCDEAHKYRNLKIFNQVIHDTEYHGFSLVLFAHRLTEILDGCNYFCEYDDKKATLFRNDMENESITSFEPEIVNESIDFLKIIGKLSDIPVKSNSEGAVGVALPEKLGFLEMFNVGNVNQLNSRDRWKNSQVVNSLATPIGVDTTGNILNLDLHEKKHGPHGLIAGMTGSGKSETIITYLLSLAVNYSPDEVQFVLIDYKGGGLAGAFENRKTGIKLPHLVGTITNLDTAEMNRTLVSIKSELQRRQRIFNKVKEELNTGTIDIYKYQGLYRDGQIKEPLSHLFIVCDEFAELKEQQTDFMDEIVSIARIGRSLGIHLILATQKPSGVVDDQVWSNSKFKICCKVQTAEDSVEMIRKPDAAYIKETGRFYLQIGYDEYYILAQSGYSGVEYIPSDRALSKLDNNVSFVNSLGEVYKNSTFKVNADTEKNKNSMGEELVNVIRYLINSAREENYKYHQLWLDNVPEVLMYENVVSKYHPNVQLYDMNPVIGEYDNPTGQSQGVVTLPITKNGNTFIVGNGGSGRNTLLSTIIWSIIINHNSDEVNIYAIDMGSEKLKKFADAPQVGDVLTVVDKSEIQFLFYMIQIELIKRQKYYADHGGDFLYDVKNKKSVFPNILIFIYDMDAFREAYDDFIDDVIGPITRNCAKYGIYFIVTGTNVNSLGYALEQNFGQYVSLNLLDSTDYSSYFEKPPIIKKNPGRGIIEINEKPYEFQTCLFFDEGKGMAFFKKVIEQLNTHLKTRAKPVPRIPEKVSFDTVNGSSLPTLDRLPLGINMITAQVAYQNFDQLVTVISSDKVTSFVKFNPVFQKNLLSVSNVKLIILNALDGISVKGEGTSKVYDSNFASVIAILKNNILKYREKKSNDKFVILILNSVRLNKYLVKQKTENNNGEVCSIPELIELAKDSSNFRFILYDLANNSEALKTGDMIDFFDGNNGIWIGNNFDNQDMFNYNSNSEFGTMSDEFIVQIQNSSPSTIKSITL